MNACSRTAGEKLQTQTISPCTLAGSTGCQSSLLRIAWGGLTLCAPTRRLHRLQRQHEARQQLAQRARASAQEDAIGWDDDLALADLAPEAAPGPTHDSGPDPSPPAPGAGAVDPDEQNNGVAHALGSSAERGEGSDEGVGESAGGAGSAADGDAAPVDKLIHNRGVEWIRWLIHSEGKLSAGLR